VWKKERDAKLTPKTYKCPEDTPLLQSGVNCGTSMRASAYMMLATALGYLVIQASPDTLTAWHPSASPSRHAPT